MKDWFSKPEGETEKKIKVERPKVIKKPRVTAPVRAYQEQTGQEAFDGFGAKTMDYEDWYKNTWPTIRTKKKRRVTIIEEEVLEEADLAPLIRENMKALKMLTQYIKSMDNSLQTLTKQPIKVEIVK